MKLQRIRYFVTLAKTLSFSRTAEICYVSQTTVSQQIRALEAELGVELLTRTKRKVELTPAGALFLEDALKIMDLLDDADEKMRLYKASGLLSLKVVIANGITPGYIAPTLNGFKNACPEVSLSCAYCHAGSVCSRLLESQADLGLLFDVGSRAHPNLRKAEFDRIAHYVVVSNRSHLALRPQVTREDLVGERFVNALESRGFIPYTDDDKAGFVTGAGGEALDVGRTDVMVESMDALLLTISLDGGYTLLAEPLAQTLSPSLNLAAIPLADETISLVMRYRADTENPAVTRFVEYVRAQRG